MRLAQSLTFKNKELRHKHSPMMAQVCRVVIERGVLVPVLAG